MANIDSKLQQLLQQIKLPDATIIGSGPISQQFLQHGITSLYAAIDYVYKLPYLAPTQPFNYTLVLEEQRGTCSTRHGLLAALAAELDISLQLGLAIYNFSPEDFAVLKPIADKYSIPYFPVSHNFLVYNKHFLDITFPGACKLLLPTQLLVQEIITPEQITQYKSEQHRKYLENWFKSNTFNFTLDQYYIAEGECFIAFGKFYSYKKPA